MEKDFVRWGLLSTARISNRLIPAIRESDRSILLAISSRNQSAADDFARTFGIPRSYGTYEAMLGDPEIDAVYISVPNGYHAEWAIKSANAGKHVLCEKPLALIVAEVDQMESAAKRNGVVLQEASMYRFHPQTLKVQELIASGTIGEVRVIRGAFSFTLVNIGDVRLDPEIGGGSLWDIGSYPVSYARALLKANPVTVFGSQVANKHGVDLTFAGQMQFSNGALAQFACSFQAAPHTVMEIIGTEGHIFMNLPWRNRPKERGIVQITRRGAATTAATFGDNVDDYFAERLVFGASANDAYLSEVESMVGSILDNVAPVVSVDDSRGNVATLVALLRSARCNHPVDVQI